MAFLGFDIEISNVFDLRPGEDLNKYAPFDISVAATALEGGESRLWLSRGSDGTPLKNLSRDDARIFWTILNRCRLVDTASSPGTG